MIVVMIVVMIVRMNVDDTTGHQSSWVAVQIAAGKNYTVQYCTVVYMHNNQPTVQQ
jgi:hypothetical protein